MRYNVIILCVISYVYSFPNFQNNVPNGHNVPNPCDSSQIWRGVGHTNLNGGGIRNPFGVDFEKEGKKWTVQLCNKDSDGDGVTNGAELGDPDCTWSPGNDPYKTINISHPGICEPLDSHQCEQKNLWLDCSVNKTCPALTENGLIKRELRIPVTAVPSKETTYMCMIFDLPQDGDYHLIATTPIIDNEQITHHILLFGCDETGGEISSTPGAYECGMLAHQRCTDIIGTWTMGTNGDCIHQDTGFLIGRKGFKRAAIQIHWNNPKKIKNYTDSSGLTIYLSSKLRQHDAGMISVGIEYLEIPPGQPEVEFSSVCPKECTSVMFPSPIYITRAVNHMHYMGIRQRISLYRQGIKLRDITNDANYHYDRPVLHRYDPPIEIQPGDELHTTCVYSSIGVNKTVHFGGGTADEMCFGFISYYPKQDIQVPYCTTWKSVQKCKRYLPAFHGVYENCRWKDFLNKTNPKTLSMVVTLRRVCSQMRQTGNCSESCIKKVEEFRSDPCLTGDLGDFLMFRLSNYIPEEVKYLKHCRNFTNINTDINIPANNRNYEVIDAYDTYVDRHFNSTNNCLCIHNDKVIPFMVILSLVGSVLYI